MPVKTAATPVSGIKHTVNIALKNYCEQMVVKAALQNSANHQLWLTIQTLLQAGGKRMRPMLVLQVCEMYGGTVDDSVLAVAVAQEILHLSMLVHDDIIDRDELRYGIKNIAGMYRDKYRLSVDENDLTHYANAAAILAGDTLIAAAYRVILESNLSDERKVHMTRYLNESIFNVVGGELGEVEDTLGTIKNANPLSTAQYKTATYSFINPILSGAVLANAPISDYDQLEAYGLSLGIAFQLVDDLLGVFGDADVTGKPNTSDLAEAKPTLLLQKTYELSSEDQKNYLKSVLGSGAISEEDASKVRGIIESVNAHTFVKQTIVGYVEKAQAALQLLHCEDNAKLPLVTLLAAATERIK